MNTRAKLLAKTGDLQLPPDIPAKAEVAPEHRGNAVGATGNPLAPQFPGVSPGVAPRTGPGQMLQFRGQMLAVESELLKLRDRLKDHEGSMPTRKLDPKSIVISQWANRHADAFKTADYERLKHDIAVAGGNVQPICVRPLEGGKGAYEVVFGHRRHRACSELGIPVLAMIEMSPISDLELFTAMDRENRERADLSPYEQGLMYRRALDAGLYPSNRRLAEALGVSHTWVANVLQVADLPPSVLECFRTPLELQHRHARLISVAIEHDRKGVLRRAEKLRQASVKLAPAAVVDALVRAEAKPTKSGVQPLQLAGRSVGSWQVDETGRLTIHVNAEALASGQLNAVLESLKNALPAR